MGRLRTRNLRARAKHEAEAKARSAKRWKPLIAGLDAFAARMLDLQASLRRITTLIPIQHPGARFPVFPKLPAVLQRGEFVTPHRPFLRPALDEEMVNVRAGMTRAIQEALARGQVVNVTLNGKVISTYRPR